MSNTWGISGPAFLALYAGLAVIGALLVVRPVGAQLAAAGVRMPWRRRSEVMVPVTLDPYELAYLSGRTGRVATVAVTELVAAGHLRVDSSGRLSATEPGPDASDAFSDTALSVVRGHSGARLQDIEKALRTSTSIEAVQDRVFSTGYGSAVVQDYTTRRTSGLAGALAVAALGLAAVDDPVIAKWLGKGTGGGWSGGGSGCGGGGCGGAGGCGG